jgi:hypothetical protein
MEAAIAVCKEPAAFSRKCARSANRAICAGIQKSLGAVCTSTKLFKSPSFAGAVPGVGAWIAFMAREREGAIDRDPVREDHLQHAAIPAVVPAVPIPRAAGHILDPDSVARRKGHVFDGARTTLAESALEDGRHAIGGAR